MIRRVEIGARDGAHLLDGEGIVGGLGVTFAVRVQVESEWAAPSLCGTVANTGVSGHRVHSPVSGAVPCFGRQRGASDFGYPVAVIGLWWLNS